MRKMLIVAGILSVFISVACLCNSFARIHRIVIKSPPADMPF